MMTKNRSTLCCDIWRNVDNFFYINIIIVQICCDNQLRCMCVMKTPTNKNFEVYSLIGSCMLLCIGL